jgi:hypothetical protein
VSARLKEWAYAGFAITLASALIAHFAVGDPAAMWSWSAGTSVLLALSYVLQTAPTARDRAPVSGFPFIELSTSTQ